MCGKYLFLSTCCIKINNDIISCNIASMKVYLLLIDQSAVPVRDGSCCLKMQLSYFCITSSTCINPSIHFSNFPRWHHKETIPADVGEKADYTFK